MIDFTNIKQLALPCHPLILRYSESVVDTLGLLFIDGKFQHYIVEDEFRIKKVKHETRIPANIYPLTLRTEGGFHERYKKHKNKRIRDMHQGMIWIKDVPDFEYILYHILNRHTNTSGCIGGGDTVNNNQVEEGFTGSSAQAYIRTYPKFLQYIKENKNPVIQIIDLL